MSHFRLFFPAKGDRVGKKPPFSNSRPPRIAQDRRSLLRTAFRSVEIHESRANLRNRASIGAPGGRLPATSERPILRVWRTLAATDIVYKAIAFALLTPLIGLLLRLLIRRTGRTAVADVDIALFFFTTKSGSVALLLVGALIIGVTALEQACLMTIVLAALRDRRLRVRDAMAHGASRAFSILRLTAMIVVRVLLIVAPFVAAISLTYWTFLRGHDINFYLTHRPPNEPGFSSAALVAAVAPLPLALMVSTHDEFVPLAETQRIFARASEPKRLWVVDAVNHRFSNNLPEFDARLMEAIAWVQHNQSR